MTSLFQVVLEREKRKSEERIQNRGQGLYFYIGKLHVQSPRNKTLETEFLKQRSLPSPGKEVK